MKASDFIAIPVLLVLFIIEATVLYHFPLFGLVPQLLLLTVVSWTLLRGLESGLMWAFIAGILLDLISPAPLGTTAIAYMIAVLAAHLVRVGLPEYSLIIPALMAATATFSSLIVQYLLLILFNFDIDFQATTQAAPLIIINALLILPLFGALALWQRFARPKPVEL